MKALSLFSGIGCFDYGVERAGWSVVGQCEIDGFCRRALAKHWPEVWRTEDVHGITRSLIRQHCGPIDAIIGGPPCQPASLAGKRGGAADDRWLWPEFLRVVREVAPMWVLAENPGGVLSLDVDGVGFREWIALQFANLGYEVLPLLLAASDLGATHERERVWIVAYANGQREQQSQRSVAEQRRRSRDSGAEMAFAARNGRREGRAESARVEGRPDAAFGGSEMGDAASLRPERAGLEIGQQGVRLADAGETMEHAACGGLALDSRLGRDDGIQLPPITRASWPMGQGFDQWDWEEPRIISSQFPMGIAAYGNARRLARWRRAGIKAIGNAVVPQCAEVIARAISSCNLTTL